jgi:hypothetical protein
MRPSAAALRQPGAVARRHYAHSAARRSAHVGTGRAPGSTPASGTHPVRIRYASGRVAAAIREWKQTDSSVAPDAETRTGRGRRPPLPRTEHRAAQAQASETGSTRFGNGMKRA